MSRRKKSFGKVKPPWVGKTKVSLIKRTEEAFDPFNKSGVPRRVTDNRKPDFTLKSYLGGRNWRARKDTKEAANAHPVNSWVRCQFNGRVIVGEVIRVYGGNYTIAQLIGAKVRVPYWATIERITLPKETVANEQG